MTKAPENKIRVPFHPLTEEELKEWYQKKYLTTAGYLLAIKKVMRPPGVDLRIPNVLEFCRYWRITKSAFYRAVSILKVNNDMDWEPMGGIILKTPEKVILLFPEEKYPTSGTVSHKRDTQSHKRDTQSHKRDTQSHKRDTQSPKPLPSKAYSTPQTYSDFIKTLSESERESFLNFGLKKCKSLPKLPELPMKWIEVNWQELYAQFKSTPEAAAASIADTDWTQHQDWEDWLAQMREGVPRFVALGTCFDNKTRRVIADWADNRGLIWGAES